MKISIVSDNNHIFLITHEPLATALKDCSLHVYACDPRYAEKINAIDVIPDTASKELTETLNKKIETLPDDAKILLLTDIAGASPANIAASLLVKRADMRLISGVNLPMVLTALCDLDKPFEVLVEAVLNAGIHSITTQQI